MDLFAVVYGCHVMDACAWYSTLSKHRQRTNRWNYGSSCQSTDKQAQIQYSRIFTCAAALRFTVLNSTHNFISGHFFSPPPTIRQIISYSLCSCSMRAPYFWIACKTFGRYMYWRYHACVYIVQRMRSSERNKKKKKKKKKRQIVVNNTFDFLFVRFVYRIFPAR